MTIATPKSVLAMAPHTANALQAFGGKSQTNIFHMQTTPTSITHTSQPKVCDDARHVNLKKVSIPRTSKNKSAYSRGGIVTSYGIALVRRIKNKAPDILFIKKRVSYSYITFVNGAYNRNNDVEMVKLFSGMTLEEKVNIMSLNFASIWYMSYLTQPCQMTTREATRYETCKARFDKRFMSDSGKRLLKLLRNTSNARNIWEMPKGIPIKNEHTLQTAIREFTEETGIRKNKYCLMWKAPPLEYTFTDDNVVYRYVYYIAEMLDHRYVPSIDASAKASSLLESSDIKFLTLEEVYNMFGRAHQVCGVVKRAFECVKRY